jgi:(p)ppGpp synthase/HD superfamily hydrolase
MSANPLSNRFTEAVELAIHLHAHQVRKGTTIPYISHLLAVASLVIEDGGDEDLAIAAILHDAVEDQGGLKTLEAIRDKFGIRVADAVLGCSDSWSLIKPAWRKRKEEHLEKIRTASNDVLSITLADKLHNSRCILRDLKSQGKSAWNRFNGGQDGTLWYYSEMLSIYTGRNVRSILLNEFKTVVEELIELSSINNHHLE